MRIAGNSRKENIPVGNGKSLIHVLFSVASICALFFVGLVFAAAPVANDDSVTTAEDTAVTISPLANDTDADGDALSI